MLGGKDLPGAGVSIVQACGVIGIAWFLSEPVVVAPHPRFRSTMECGLELFPNLEGRSFCRAPARRQVKAIFLHRVEAMRRVRRNKRSRIFENLEVRQVLDSTVVFNEIMYNAADGDDSVEWIELYNQLAVDMDISEWEIKGGVDFAFPDDTIVPGRGYLVVALDPQALEDSTGFNKAIGPYAGRLSNSGDSLKLYNNDHRLMNSVEFNDGGEWQVAADGGGVSLAKQDQKTASEDPGNWTHSVFVGGTPGASNFQEDGTRITTTLIDSEAPAKAIVPTDNSLGRDWTELAFNDSAWDDWYHRRWLRTELRVRAAVWARSGRSA